jgi:hypothetical protein
VGQHGSASGSILLGLDGFEVTTAEVVNDEWQLEVQTTAIVVGCVGCGVRAEAHGRRTVRVRDLPIGGRPVVLAWRKRIWRCGESACSVRTWTERTAAVCPRAVLTERARAEACRRVGKDAHAVAAVARDLGVGWATVMRAVTEHGTPLVDDAARLEGVAALGLDETCFLKATRVAPPSGSPAWWTWRAVGCWTWWPTAPGPRWPAGLVPGRAAGWPRSPWWRSTPGAGMPAPWWPRWATPGWWWTTSTPSGWPTRWSIRLDGGPSRPPSATGAASQIRCTASASCC